MVWGFYRRNRRAGSLSRSVTTGQSGDGTGRIEADSGCAGRGGAALPFLLIAFIHDTTITSVPSVYCLYRAAEVVSNTTRNVF